jgi:carboxymethylenebutenolidase
MVPRKRIGASVTAETFVIETPPDHEERRYVPMKRLVVLVLFLPLTLPAQQAKSCCSTISVEQFSMLGTDENLKPLGDEPAPFKFSPQQGSFVTFKTSDGKEGRAFEVKAPVKTDKYLFVFHEWWGLNDYIRQEAEKLQKDLKNVNVLALDLYDSKVATTREDAMKYVGEAKQERVRAIIQGAFGYVGAKAEVGTIGWCYGGGWSLQTAIMGGNRVVACVVYYGSPETDLEKLKALHAPVLGIFGEQDKGITPARVKAFEADMKKAGRPLTVKMYDADHAFANPSNPKHDKDATADAYKRTIAFLQKNLVK